VGRPEKAERRLQERVTSGKAVPWHFYTPVWLWRGLSSSLPLAALLVGVTAWDKRILVPRDVPSSGLPPGWSKFTPAMLSVITLYAVFNGMARMDLSIWGDEDYTIKTYIADQVTEQPDGSLQFEKPSWANALWNFKRPNNHVGFTVLAKASHDAFFAPGKGPKDAFFSESLVRAPAYLAGLASIAALWWAAGVYGMRFAAWFVLPFFYVIHPWFMRFSSDARGYSILLLLIPLCLGAVGRAVQTGRWRWWLMLAFCQFYAMWTWPSVIYVIAALNLAVPCMCLTATAWTKEEKKLLLLRWLASGLLSAIAVVLLMAPLLPQMQDFMRTSGKGLEGGLDLHWAQDVLAYTLFGTPWFTWDAHNPLCHSIQHSAAKWGYLLVGAGMLLSWAYGAWCMSRERSQRWLLVVILGAPALMLLHLGLTGVRPYHWYLLIFLPGWVMLMLPVAQSWLKRQTKDWRKYGLFALLLALFFLSSKERSLLRHHPIEPNRESVFLTQQVTNPRHPDYGKESITAGFTMFTEAYDPTMVRFQTATELQELMKKARDSQRDLYINFGSRAFCEANYPELFHFFNDAAVFEVVKVLPGQFAAGTREVLKWRRK
jgi:hypothetical protein